ncbi:MAG: helix-turn-helix domain-containing protein [Candidatus Levybacteria bacterium]|nr:helix-turn-helix domain-containing protein [Candidatus Levybacteria bacterium]
MGNKSLNGKRFLTVAEVSGILRLSVLTIYKYIKEGKISAFDFGGHYRISDSSLEDFIEDHKVFKKDQNE